ncbi:MAG: sigma-70 family RNA polymerase sigma factor [Pirellulales bacterium]|nr:sigma-70 family RNA polymerase sigma factor [Pirellulales bacterium]
MSTEQQYRQEFLKLYGGCEAWLFNYLLSLLRKPEDAQEVLQETAKVCWEKLDQYHPNTEFRAWACRIAYYNAMKFHERQKKAPLPFSDLFFSGVDVEAVVMADQLEARMAALKDCVKKLPAADRKLLKLRYGPKGTVKAAAEVLDFPLHRIYRALARIHNILYYCIGQTLSAEEGQL